MSRQNFDAGKGGNVIINGLGFSVTKWELTRKPISEDVTDTSHDGTVMRQSCWLEDWEAYVEATYDPIVEIEGILPADLPGGSKVENIYFYRGTSGKSYRCDSAVIDTLKVLLDAKGVVRVQLTIKAAGSRLNTPAF